MNDTVQPASAFDIARFIVDVLVAAGTLAVAAFTAYLAIKTRDLAVEGRTAQDQAETQHRQQLMPVCKITGNTYVERAPNGRLQVAIPGITNAGPGPALNVRIRIEAPNHEPGIDWAYLGPIGPGERAEPPSTCPLKTPNESFDAVRLHIKYEDVFGQHFETTYRRDPIRVHFRGPFKLPPGPGTCDF